MDSSPLRLDDFKSRRSERDPTSEKTPLRDPMTFVKHTPQQPNSHRTPEQDTRSIATMSPVSQRSRQIRAFQIRRHAPSALPVARGQTRLSRWAAPIPRPLSIQKSSPKVPQRRSQQADPGTPPLTKNEPISVTKPSDSKKPTQPAVPSVETFENNEFSLPPNPTPRAETPVKADEGAREFTIEKLLDWDFARLDLNDKATQGTSFTPEIFIKVSWLGYSDQENSWEPEANLHGQCRHLLISFWRRHGGRSQAIRKRLAKSGSSTNAADETYLIHEIVSSRKTAGGTTYLIDWVGYPVKDRTWLDAGNIPAEVIGEYRCIQKSKKS